MQTLLLVLIGFLIIENYFIIRIIDALEERINIYKEAFVEIDKTFLNIYDFCDAVYMCVTGKSTKKN